MTDAGATIKARRLMVGVSASPSSFGCFCLLEESTTFLSRFLSTADKNAMDWMV